MQQNNKPRDGKPQITASRAPDHANQRRQIRSAELLDGCREVSIEHAGELYLLRQTSKGKLILTK